MLELKLPHELIEESAEAAVPGVRGLELSGDLPILELEDGSAVVGAYAISERFDELMQRGGFDARWREHALDQRAKAPMRRRVIRLQRTRRRIAAGAVDCLDLRCRKLRIECRERDLAGKFCGA